LKKKKKRELFKKGQRVEHTAIGYMPIDFLLGSKGMVVQDQASFDSNIAIRWDERHRVFHNLDGMCEARHGYWVDQNYVKVVQTLDDLEEMKPLKIKPVSEYMDEMGL